MIERVRLMYHVSESVHGNVCGLFGLDAAKGRNGAVCRKGEAISRVELYNMLYERWGRIWFLEVTVDFPLLGCTYGDFPRYLYAAYHALFGDIAHSFPPYEEAVCTYIEYADVLEDRGSAEIASRARSHGTIGFQTARLEGGRLRTLAGCHGTALKKRIRDTSLHRPAGVAPWAAVSARAEREILAWLYDKHGLS